MAFRKDKTTAAQTSANVAGGVVSAFIAAGVIKTTAAASKALVELTEAELVVLGPIVDEDNEGFAAAEAAGGGSSKSSGSKSSGSKGGRKSGGNQDPGDIELKGGKFKGCTIREVYEMDADEAGDTYGHRDGEAGSTYVDWLATSKNPNEFTRKVAKEFLKAVEGDDE